ncbi:MULTISPECIES: heme oxygenase (biliverdin-producing) [unclassified Pseudactinotalea]|uniref:biliverdin-producing heme oxygenase n=1 Tax=unclassified Pseudactinotalea TaxID=2649176 RepID=UPI00128B7D83|nr:MULTISPECIES: biliverdin-producing heme oxygenase [unclassified Pseudactinotalea]MPV48659.1 biliverdin-producing heme oxygenase [Pseudactinotalea sp. HY160]QGH68629.1 biliverdin-producing heme oxygenase [Pseudactinotalea sp. HY158]
MTTTPLSELLRTATREQHEHAETRTFVTDLMSGRLGRPAYIDLAVQHEAIYTALEQLGERLSNDPITAAFLLPELIRLPSIEADLVAMVGADWREHTSLVPATEVYVDRLAAISTPAQYVAHAYTRYLGDLSGGQAISAMLRRHYGIPPEELTFYSFTAIPKVKPFKDSYRALLDAAAFTDAQRAEAVAEAKIAFDLNAALFVDLGARNESLEVAI